MPKLSELGRLYYSKLDINPMELKNKKEIINLISQKESLDEILKFKKLNMSLLSDNKNINQENNNEIELFPYELANLDINKAANEMKENAGIEMNHFAFPFGEATAVSQHDIDLLKNMDFKTSATTNDGLVCYGTDMLELPRLFVTEKNWKQVIDRIVKNC